jgi:hypothetical protein
MRWIVEREARVARSRSRQGELAKIVENVLQEKMFFP